jgi:hypothetical protein
MDYGCVENVDSCAVAASRHVLETEPPFGEIETANCSLIRSSTEGDIPSILQALAAGADINTRLPMWVRVRSSEATYAPDIKGVGGEAVEFIDKNDFPQTGAVGLTPLMYASCEGHVDAVKLLISLRADMDMRDEDGMQAIHLAAEAASSECFRILMEEGADPLVKDDFSRDAFQCVPFNLITCSATKEEWAKLIKAGLSAWEKHEPGYTTVAAVVGASNNALPHGSTQNNDSVTTKELSGEEHNDAEEAVPHFEGHHFELTSCVKPKREESLSSNSTSATVDHEV